VNFAAARMEEENWVIFDDIMTVYCAGQLPGMTVKREAGGMMTWKEFPATNFQCMFSDSNSQDRTNYLTMVRDGTLSLERFRQYVETKKLHNRMWVALCTMTGLKDHHEVRAIYPDLTRKEFFHAHRGSFTTRSSQNNIRKMDTMFKSEVQTYMDAMAESKKMKEGQRKAILEMAEIGIDQYKMYKLGPQVFARVYCDDVIELGKVDKEFMSRSRLAIYDPPYGYFRDTTDWDARCISEGELTSALSRAKSHTGHGRFRLTYVVFCDLAMTPMVIRVMQKVCDKVQTLHWCKQKYGGSGKKDGDFASAVEYMVVGFCFSDEDNEMTKLPPGFINFTDKESRVNYVITRPVLAPVKSSSTSRAASTAVNPTQKPLTLLIWLIEHFSRVGDTVLDMFSGVGTFSCSISANTMLFFVFCCIFHFF
jgi:hypothetical protein